jgi:hypothetical protein
MKCDISKLAVAAEDLGTAAGSLPGCKDLEN